MSDVPSQALLFMLVAAVVLVFGFAVTIAKRYKRCPSNKILVIYGKVRQGQSARCLHGGGTFVWPLIQSFEFLTLDPIQIEIPLEGALSIENIRVAVPSVFTVAIGTDSETMNNAAIRLLGLQPKEVMKQAEDIIFGQLRQVIASMRIEDINRDRDQFLASVQSSLEGELRKIGLVLINVNIKDITDESGYIEAIGRKAASEAIQQAEIDVAEQNKKGAIGVANAEREEAIAVAEAQKTRDIGTTTANRDKAVKVADLEKEKSVGQQRASFEQESQVREAERQMRIEVASANAAAVAGENTAKATVAATDAELRIKEAEANASAVSGENQAQALIADANATLRIKQAEAYEVSESKHRQAQAAVLEAQYLAEAKAAEAEAKKQEAEKRAELEAVAKAVKAQVVVQAEADAEKQRIEAEGEAKAIFAKLEAQAKGEYEILARKGEGLRQIVAGCGGPQSAFQLLMLEHIEKLSEHAANAISNVQFDKVVVWDGGGQNGQGATAGFLKSLVGSLPPVLSLARDIGGVDLPDYFGKIVNPAEEAGKDSQPDAEETTDAEAEKS